MAGKLSGKIAVITGGSTGIGLAAAQRFVREGAHVFITGRRQAELDAAVKLIGDSVTAVRGDVANPADLERLYETVRRDKGRVDIVFANAGIGEFLALGALTEAHYDRIFDVNVKGLLFTVQNALPLMPDGGSIILNASIAGVSGVPAFSVYSASKAAVRSFARGWANELAGRRIRVNAISPGPIETPILSGLGATPQAVSEMKASFVAGVPLGRIGQPEEVAAAALFLASEESSYITGIDLFVDGGMAQV